MRITKSLAGENSLPFLSFLKEFGSQIVPILKANIDRGDIKDTEHLKESIVWKTKRRGVGSYIGELHFAGYGFILEYRQSLVRKGMLKLSNASRYRIEHINSKKSITRNDRSLLEWWRSPVYSLWLKKVDTLADELSSYELDMLKDALLQVIFKPNL